MKQVKINLTKEEYDECRKDPEYRDTLIVDTKGGGINWWCGCGVNSIRLYHPEESEDYYAVVMLGDSCD